MKKLLRFLLYTVFYTGIYGSLLLSIAWIIFYPYYYLESTLYYYDNKAKQFVEEKKMITKSFSEVESKTIKQVINALLLEPNSLLLKRNQKPYLKCLDVHLFDANLLAINFSEELAELTTAEEKILMHSLALTIKANFPNVKRVQILLVNRSIDFLQGAYFYGKALNVAALLMP